MTASYACRIGRLDCAWRAALRTAQLPALRFHDLRLSDSEHGARRRRPGDRDARLGSVFDRYNIVSEEDLKLAMQKTEAYVSTLPTERNVERAQNARNAAVARKAE